MVVVRITVLKAPYKSRVLFLYLFAMYEQQKILNKIERLVDQIPYQSVKIEIELKDQVLILQKEKPKQCGFLKDESR